ncbi:MAG: nuclear transport factor 2 family protein [Gammaproteobacteria bacterium]|nr:nuclear transport factor 2 family protein [Gammaproteobacteria bacterium]
MPLSIIDTFNRFAEAFEAAVHDDNWLRLNEYLAEDATYINVGGPDPKAVGRDAVVAFLKADVSNNDRRFDTRTLVALTRPVTEGNGLSRRWRCTYTLADTPNLVVEGEARYCFDNDLIKSIEEEITNESIQRLADWMEKYGSRLDT